MPPPPTRLLAPQAGFPLPVTTTVLTSNQNNAVVQAFYNTLRTNDFQPNALQMPHIVLWVNGERMLAYFSAGVAVQINQRSQNLVQLNTLEQQLRGDTVLRWVLAPTQWKSFFYHVQSRQAIWEYMTADEEYGQPCIPCSRADLTGGQIRHCTPTRRCGDRKNVVCARCLHTGRPNLCMWPGDTAPTPLSAPVNRPQRAIHQLIAVRDAVGSPSAVRTVSPILPPGATPSRQAAGSPLRLPSPMQISPRTPPVKQESRAGTPQSLGDSISRMSISPLPGDLTHDDILLQINLLNIQRNYIVYGTHDLQQYLRQELATAWNQQRYYLSQDLRMLSQVYRNGLGGYIHFGYPPKINPSLGPDPNPVPHTTTPTGSPSPSLRGASVPPPVAPPPRGGNQVSEAAMNQVLPGTTTATGSGQGGGAPRQPITPVRGPGGPRTPSAIADFFRLDPANLPTIDLAPGVD